MQPCTCGWHAAFKNGNCFSDDSELWPSLTLLTPLLLLHKNNISGCRKQKHKRWAQHLLCTALTHIPTHAKL